MSDKIEQLEHEVRQLRRWKEDQLQVEAQWNPQEVAKLLGMNVGVGIRAEIEPAIRSLIERHNRLEVLAGELIAVIRVNVMRGTFRDATIEQVDESLKPMIDRLSSLRGKSVVEDVGCDLAEAKEQRDKLAEALKVARDALDKLSRLGNGQFIGNSTGNAIARDAYNKTELVASTKGQTNENTDS